MDLTGLDRSQLGSSAPYPFTSSAPNLFDTYHYDPTAGSTALEMTVAVLCARIDASPVIAALPLIGIEWRKEKSGVKHEYLIIEYRLPPEGSYGMGFGAPTKGNKLDSRCYLRLDRAATTSYQGTSAAGRATFTSKSASSVFPVNDSVSISVCDVMSTV